MNYKLNHISLCVINPEESARFYQKLFEMLGLPAEQKCIGENIMVLGPEGASIGLKKISQNNSVGMDHFGFTTDNPSDLESIAEKLSKSNIPFERKEHRDGSRSIFLKDGNDYLIQIVYMPPVIL